MKLPATANHASQPRDVISVSAAAQAPNAGKRQSTLSANWTSCMLARRRLLISVEPSHHEMIG